VRVEQAILLLMLLFVPAELWFCVDQSLAYKIHLTGFVCHIDEEMILFETCSFIKQYLPKSLIIELQMTGN